MKMLHRFALYYYLVYYMQSLVSDKLIINLYINISFDEFIREKVEIHLNLKDDGFGSNDVA